MKLLSIIQKNKQEIKTLAGEHGAVRIQVFGSVARGEDTQKSDVDFLVEAGPNPSPWFPGGLLMDLQDLLGVQVDVVTKDGLKDRIKAEVLQEAIDL